MMLSDLGHRADVAANGLEAVTAVQRDAYDLVLMDVRMPQLGGTQAARQIRALTGRPQAPWIVAMTADDNDSDREECLASGMNDFLGKPVRQDDLEAALARAARDHVRQVTGQCTTGCVDTTVILKLTQRDPEKVRVLCHAYLEDASATLLELDRLAAVKDFENLRQKLHYLKGSSIIVGATRATSLCREAEACALIREPIDSVLKELHNACRDTASSFAELVRAIDQDQLCQTKR